MIYYFAYGSNMDEKRMKERVKNYKIIGTGILKNYKLVFNKIPINKSNEGYANIIPHNNENVEGVIYEIDEDGINKLDKCEGKPDHYNRKSIYILHNNMPIICKVYIANEYKINNNLKPSIDYLNHLLEGKEYLSKEYYNKLKKIKTI